MPFPVSFRALTLVAAVVSLAGCSGASRGIAVPGVGADRARSSRTLSARPLDVGRGVPFVGKPGTLSALAPVLPAARRQNSVQPIGPKKSATWKASVFVSDYGGASSTGAVYQFAPNKTGKVLGTIKDVVNPQGMDMDSKGDLWVASTGSYQVNEYTPGTYTASTVLSDPNEFPVSVAVCPNGTVYVMNAYNVSFGPGDIEIYAAGATSPSGTISDANIYVPYFAACDANNVLWFDYANFNFYTAVASYDGSTVTEYGTLNIGFPGGIRVGKNGTTLGIDDQYEGVELFTKSDVSAGPYFTLPVSDVPVSFSFNKKQTDVWVADYGQTDALEYVLKTSKEAVAVGAKTLQAPTDALVYPPGNT
jgi:hypothetical protein